MDGARALVLHPQRLTRTVNDGGKARVGVLISGRGSNMAALIEAARDPACPYEIALILSNVTDAPGLETARRAGIETFAHSHRGMKRADYDAILDAELRRAGIEWVALAGYMRLLSPWFIDRWRGRIVNIHPSLLPAHKGLDTHAAALAVGDVEAGCTVHIVTEGLDDGPILAQARVPILPGDDAEALAARVLIEEHRLYPRALATLVRGSGASDGE
ncbi:MAG: phosphoribosylglycinamide formyltransferase [Sphingomonas bacterium]|nr:phosphoribosylglycinamide formyltransferase [Sphingomonas bacterium]